MSKKNIIKDINEAFERVGDIILKEHYEIALKIINKLYSQSLEINYEKGIGLYYETYVLILYYTQNNQKALTFLYYIINNIKKAKNPNKKKLAKFYMVLGVTLSRLHSFESSTTYIEKSLELTQINFPKEHQTIANTYLALAFNEMNIQNFDKATTYINKGFEVLEIGNVIEGELDFTKVYLSIYKIKILIHKGELKKAIFHFNKLQNTKKIQQRKEKSYLLELELMLCIKNNSDADKIEILFQKILRLAIELKDDSLKIRILTIVKDFHRKNDNFLLAFKYANRIIEINDRIKNMQVYSEKGLKMMKNVSFEKDDDSFEIYLKSDLNLAAKYQSNFFNNKLKSEKIDADILFTPSKTLSGDYVGVFNLSNADNHYLFVLADVVGKGITASYISFMIEGVIKSILLNSDSYNLKLIIKDINTILYETLNGQGFVSLWAGIIDINNNTLESINAGHLPTYFVTKKKITELSVGPTILGMFFELPPFESEIISFNKNCTLIAYSDGITEAINTKGNMFENNFYALVQSYSQSKEIDFMFELKKGLSNFKDDTKIQDDISCLVVSVKK